MGGKQKFMVARVKCEHTFLFSSEISPADFYQIFFFIIQWCMGENVWAKYKKGCQYFFFTRKVIIDVSNMERIYGIYKIDNK